MTDNKLTPAQIERLALLAEEAAEVAQIAMKIVRFGYDDNDPRNGVLNTDKLISEIADFFASYNILANSGDITIPNVTEWQQKIDAAEVKKRRYSYHQKEY